uniref:Uncharacterized protein n=1 Tax=Arundo donax TaxID=35708 RepID=A0A0A9GBF7_ARUDO
MGFLGTDSGIRTIAWVRLGLGGRFGFLAGLLLGLQQPQQHLQPATEKALSAGLLAAGVLAAAERLPCTAAAAATQKAEANTATAGKSFLRLLRQVVVLVL